MAPRAPQGARPLEVGPRPELCQDFALTCPRCLVWFPRGPGKQVDPDGGPLRADLTVCATQRPRDLGRRPWGGPEEGRIGSWSLSPQREGFLSFHRRLALKTLKLKSLERLPKLPAHSQEPSLGSPSHPPRQEALQPALGCSPSAPSFPLPTVAQGWTGSSTQVARFEVSRLLPKNLSPVPQLDKKKRGYLSQI